MPERQQAQRADRHGGLTTRSLGVAARSGRAGLDRWIGGKTSATLKGEEHGCSRERYGDVCLSDGLVRARPEGRRTPVGNDTAGGSELRGHVSHGSPMPRLVRGPWAAEGRSAMVLPGPGQMAQWQVTRGNPSRTSSRRERSLEPSGFGSAQRGWQGPQRGVFRIPV